MNYYKTQMQSDEMILPTMHQILDSEKETLHSTDTVDQGFNCESKRKETETPVNATRIKATSYAFPLRRRCVRTKLRQLKDDHQEAKKRFDCPFLDIQTLHVQIFHRIFGKYRTSSG